MSAKFAITYDARSINKDRVRGIGRYLYELIGHVSQVASLDLDIRLLGDRIDQPFNAPPAARVHSHARSLRGQHLGTWEQIYVPWRIMRSRPNIFHAPATTVPLIQQAPTVVTVHDLKPWGRKHDWWEQVYWQKLVSRGLEKADAIVTPSYSTQKDLISAWPHLRDKIQVIPHGLSDAYIGAVRKTRSTHASVLGCPYLLYIGGPAPNKRFDIALQVFSALRRKWKSLNLVVCGYSNRARAKVSLERRSAEGVKFMPFVPDEQMVDLYSNAAAVLYPTEYEGFGFPVLEAQACGTPIIVNAAAGSLADLPGPEVHFVSSREIPDWSDVVEYCISRKRNGEHNPTGAAAWAQRFTWPKSAAKHVELYKSIA